MKLELKNISKTFKKQVVLEDVNLTLTPGKIYGFVGRNGSGKTVLLKIICGILNPDSGVVLFDGEDYISHHGLPKSTRALIEEPDFIPSLSGYENLKLIADIQKKIKKDRILEVLKIVGIEDVMNKKYDTYSLGMKQKLGIAQVIMEDVDLLILDEPFNALDEQSTKEMRHLLKQLKEDGKIIIIATHIKEDIKNLIDELYNIENGKVTKNGKK